MSTSSDQNLALWLVNKKNWLTHFLIVAGICIAGLIYLGGATYTGAPPLEDYVSATTGETVFTRAQIKRGQELFHIRGLMSYGSFWGDGAERGPDFTADALHRTVETRCAILPAKLRAERIESVWRSFSEGPRGPTDVEDLRHIVLAIFAHEHPDVHEVSAIDRVLRGFDEGVARNRLV